MTQAPIDITSNNRLMALAADVRDNLDVIEEATRQIEAATKVRAIRSLAAGRALLEAKALLPRGHWLPWLKEHCRIPERSAQLYMQVAAGLARMPDEVAVINLTHLGLERTAQMIKKHPWAMQPLGVWSSEFDALDEADKRPWRLYMLFTPDRVTDDDNVEHVDWLLRHTPCKTPDAWMQAVAEGRVDHHFLRGMWERHERSPVPVWVRWEVFRDEHADTSDEAIMAMLAKRFGGCGADNRR